MQIIWTQSTDSKVFDDALALRKAVFVEEQHVPLELELDGRDDQCDHVVGYNHQQAIATARLAIDSTQAQATVQRFAVDMNYRGTGIGRQLMQAIKQYSQEQLLKTLVLSAQVHAVDFYQKLGFTVVSKEPYLDAGIEHLDMIYSIEQNKND